MAGLFRRVSGGPCCGLLGTSWVRWASKKAAGLARNQGGQPKGKHRGWKMQDGGTVEKGFPLVLQNNNVRFHPGLQVGMARNMTLFALERGRVMVTCEKLEPNWDSPWVKLFYTGREDQTIYKKFFNIIPDKQHCRFRLVNKV